MPSNEYGNLLAFCVVDVNGDSMVHKKSKYYNLGRSIISLGSPIQQAVHGSGRAIWSDR